MSPTAAPPRHAQRPKGDRTPRRPGVDPRIRQRRARVARRAGRRRLGLILAAVALCAVLVGGWVLVHAGPFEARVVTVRPGAHTPAAQIVAASGITRDTPLIDIDAGAVAARIERLPWVKTATVGVRWPDGVALAVTERTPVAVVSVAQQSTATTPSSPSPTPAGAAHPAGSDPGSSAPAPAGSHPSASEPAGSGASASEPAGSGASAAKSVQPAITTTWALVDGHGRVLADASSPPTGLRRLVVPVAAGPPGTTLSGRDASGVAVVSSLPPAFAAQVTEVSVGTSGQVTLHLTTPVTVDLGDAAQLEQKYEDVAAVLAGAKLVAGDVIDVSIPQSPVVGEG